MDDFQVKQAEQQQMQQQQQVQEQQQQMHMHLIDLQNWDRAEGQTIEERRMEQNTYLMEQELERNVDMKNAWIEKCRKIEADRTAEGRPVQIQRPAQKTYKQRREDKRLDSKAKKITPLADHMSIHMVERLKKKKNMHSNSFTQDMIDEAVRQHVDRRVLNTFVSGYETNKNGEPLNEYQQNRKELDRQFLEDYISKDEQRRKPHLDRMLEQVLNTDITEEMLEPEYMEYHAGELHEQISRLVYFDNVYKDPVNKAYFDALPTFKKDLLQCKVLSRYAYYGSLFSHVCALRGVDADGAKMEKCDKAKADKDREIFTALADVERQQMRDMLAESRSRERMLIQNEFERMYEVEREQLMRNGEQMKQAVEQDKMKTEKGEDMTNLNLTSYVTGYSFDVLAKHRKMIEDHPEEYQENAKLVDTLYQQMYRSVDALGDITLAAMATQGVMDALGDQMPQQTRLKSAMQKKALIQLAETDARAQVVRQQISGMADALEGLLRHKEMTPSAIRMMEQLG